MKNKFFLFIWMLTLTPLLRFIWGYGISWVDIGYPLALLLGFLIILFREKYQTKHITEGRSRFKQVY
jgi:hypothetical protein